MTYNVKYFIDKFEAIPENQWCTGIYTDINNRHCAMGHCGKFNVFKDTEESNELYHIFNYHRLVIAIVNDGDSRNIKPGDTPKQRILNALKSFTE